MAPRPKRRSKSDKGRLDPDKIERFNHKNRSIFTKNGAALSSRQIIAIEALVSRTPDETAEDVAARAKVSIRTMQRYMEDEEFELEYRKQALGRLRMARGVHVETLYKAAFNGDASILRLFFEMTGDLGKGLNQVNVQVNSNGDAGSADNQAGLNGHNTGVIDVGTGSGTMILPIEKLPLEMKVKLLEIVEAEQKEKEIEQRRAEENNRVEQAKRITGRRS